MDGDKLLPPDSDELFPRDLRSTPALGLTSIPYSLPMLGLALIAVLLVQSTLWFLEKTGIPLTNPTTLAQEALVTDAPLGDNENPASSTPSPPQNQFILLITAAIQQPLSLALIILVTLSAWIFFCVPISRCTVLRIARNHHLSLGAALNYGLEIRRKTTLYPIAFVALLAGLLATNGLVGLIAQIPGVGPILLIPLYLIAFLASILLALLLVCGLAGAGTSTAALVTEASGTLESTTRAFSYFFARPLHFIFFHTIILLFAGFVGYLGCFITSLSIDSLALFYQGEALTNILSIARTAKTPPDTDASFLQWTAGLFLWFGVGLGHALSVALSISFYFSGTTAAYLSLRSEVDGVPLDNMPDTIGVEHLHNVIGEPWDRTN